MTGGLAGVAAGQGLQALLATGRTGPGVTVVRRHLTVVTPWTGGTQLLAAGRPGGLLTAAGDGHLGLTTVTGDTHLELARIAGSGVTARHTFVIFTTESFPAGLLTWRTLAWAALLVTGVPTTVPQFFALYLAGKRLGALNLLRLSSTPSNQYLFPSLKVNVLLLTCIS